MSSRRLALAFALTAVTLAACTTGDRFHEACAARGITPDTPAFNKCLNEEIRTFERTYGLRGEDGPRGYGLQP